MLHLFAPAKVNLSLEILGRRPDGYHDVRTVLQAIDLCDELMFEAADALTLHVEPEGAAPLEDNLVLRAARRLRHAFNVQAGASISLRKRIPMSAGLGGGSSDAAAALRGLRQLWKLPVSAHGLMAIAAELGSDVPFFLEGGTALGEGKGDILTPLPRPVERFAVVLVPTQSDDDAKTKRLYGLLRPEHYSNGSRTAALVEQLRAGLPVANAMTNTFEEVAPQAFTGYSAACGAFESAGGKWVRLSGAGPSLFSLAEDKAAAEALRAKLTAAGYLAYAVELLSAGHSDAPQS